jgi:hypothetical protein
VRQSQRHTRSGIHTYLLSYGEYPAIKINASDARDPVQNLGQGIPGLCLEDVAPKKAPFL